MLIIQLTKNPLPFTDAATAAQLSRTFSCPTVCASVIRFVAANTCVARVLPLLLLGQVDSRENGFRLWLLTMEVSSPMRDGFHGLNGGLLRDVRDVLLPTANISNPIRPSSNINCGNTHRHLLTGRYPICAGSVVKHSDWMCSRQQWPCKRLMKCPPPIHDALIYGFGGYRIHLAWRCPI